MDLKNTVYLEISKRDIEEINNHWRGKDMLTEVSKKETGRNECGYLFFGTIV